MIVRLFPSKSSGSGKDEAEAADAGFELAEGEEVGRGGRRLHSALTLTPGPPLIVGSPCTGAKANLVLSKTDALLDHPDHHSNHQDWTSSLLPDPLKMLLHSPPLGGGGVATL